MNSQPAHDHGFTLVELLVVMVVIGILASVAIPLFLNQRAKAHDSAVQADVSNLGKEVATYFIDNPGPVSLVVSGPHRIDITDGSYTTFARLTVGSVPPASGAVNHLDDPTAWCVALTDPKGSGRIYRYTALTGLQTGDCS